MKKPPTKVIYSRIEEEDYMTISRLCKEQRDTPARIFRNLILGWIDEQKKKRRK